MTKLLEQAFAAAARLSAEDQDAFARALLSDLASEGTIDERLASTPGAIERLAEEALTEYRSGRTEPLDPERL